MRILSAAVLLLLVACTQKNKEGVDGLEFFFPPDGTKVSLAHEIVSGSPNITETLSYQWDKATNQVNRVHKFSDPQMPEVTEVFQLGDAELVKIAHLSATSSKTGLQEKLANRKVAIGDKIDKGQYEVKEVHAKYSAGNGKTLDPCIEARGGKYDTEVWYCKGYGLVKKWSNGLPSSMSKGFAM